AFHWGIAVYGTGLCGMTSGFTVAGFLAGFLAAGFLSAAALWSVVALSPFDVSSLALAFFFGAVSVAGAGAGVVAGFGAGCVAACAGWVAGGVAAAGGAAAGCGGCSASILATRSGVGCGAVDMPASGEALIESGFKSCEKSSNNSTRTTSVS